MAKALFDHSYDRETLGASYPATFKDGCEGVITGRRAPFARITSLPNQPHSHSIEMAWETVAWAYVDKGRPFPIA